MIKYNKQISNLLLATTIIIINNTSVQAENFVISDTPIQFQNTLDEDEYLTGSDVTDILTQKTYNGAPGLNDLLAKPVINVDEGEPVPDTPEDNNVPPGSGGKVPSSGSQKMYTEVKYDSNGTPDNLVNTGSPSTSSGGSTLQGIHWPFDMNRIQGNTISLNSWFSYRNGGDLEFHNGLDLGGCTGENGVAGQLNLYAPADCKISAISHDTSPYSGFGNLIAMDFQLEGSTTTYRFLYAHMDYINAQLKVGTEIKQGEYVGRIGNTGQSRGNHVHFSILCSENGDFTGVNGIPSMTQCGSTDYLVNPLIVYGLPVSANGDTKQITQWGTANKVSMSKGTYTCESTSDAKAKNKTFSSGTNVTEKCFKQIILPDYLLS